MHSEMHELADFRGFTFVVVHFIVRKAPRHFIYSAFLYSTIRYRYIQSMIRK